MGAYGKMLEMPALAVLGDVRDLLGKSLMNSDMAILRSLSEIRFFWHRSNALSQSAWISEKRSPAVAGIF